MDGASWPFRQYRRKQAWRTNHSGRAQSRRKATVYIHPIFAPCRLNIQPGVRTNLLEFPFDSTCNTCSTPASWQFVRSVAGRLGKGASLTPRELSVLRSLSLGHRIAEISNDLGLGEETVRSHIKKAQAKLGVRNTTHAVAQAVRLRLIP